MIRKIFLIVSIPVIILAVIFGAITFIAILQLFCDTPNVTIKYSGDIAEFSGLVLIPLLFFLFCLLTAISNIFALVLIFKKAKRNLFDDTGENQK